MFKMEKEDFSYQEENNFSTISNEDLQDISSITDCSISAVPTSSFTSSNNRGNNNYGYSRNQGPSNHFMGDMQGSSSGNEYSKEQFRQYIDQLTAHLYRYDRDGLQHLEDNLAKFKNGEIDIDMGRTTPLLFPEMHALAKLDFPGLIYQLIPNALSHNGGIISITDEIYPKYFDFQIDDYPGPLTLEKTTEEQIFYYLKDQMSMELQDTSPIDWDSGHLLISYLELLIKENGKPRISNVVRLLNDGIETRTADLKKEFRPYESVSRNSYSRASSRAVSRASSRAVSPENVEPIDPSLPQNSLDYPKGPGSVASVMRRAVTTLSSDQKLCQDMDKYREYILSGRFEEAVNYAMKAGIWDHAFALALRMNNTALVNEILTRFSRRAIFSNDPLFTMHELMASRPPRIVATNRGFSNSEMGDWRCHLSMILAVKKFRPEESRQAVESMGEKLLLLRSHYAAHLCYLLAGTPLGLDRTSHRYRRKYDLIGWPSSTAHIPAQKSSYDSCHRLFSGFEYWRSAPEHCIKLTEIYEYVLRLRGDDAHKPLSVHLLPYKYVMTYRMLCQQRPKSAYEYCRAIGEIFGYRGVDWLRCESVTFTMVRNVRDLGYRLHSLLSVVVGEDDGDGELTIGASDTWLSNIDDVYCLFCDKYGLWNPRKRSIDLFAEENQSVTSEEQVERAPSIVSNRRQSQPPNNSSHYEERVVRPPMNIQKPPQSHTNSGYYEESEGRHQTNNQRPSQQHTKPNDREEKVVRPQANYQKPSQSHINQNYHDQNDFCSPVSHQKPSQPTFTSNPPFSESNVIRQPIKPPSSSQPFTNQSYHDQNDFRPPVSHQTPPQPQINPPAKFEASIAAPIGNHGYQFPPIPPPSDLPSDVISPVPPQPLHHQIGTRPMFVPQIIPHSTNQQPAIADCFTTLPSSGYSRSRSQSNGSVASAESVQKRPPIKTTMTTTTNTIYKEPVPATVKEESERPKEEDDSDKKKEPGWNPLGWLLPKQTKGVFLPDDSQKPLEYDAEKKRWIDKSNPDSDRPPTPPPMMPMMPAGMAVGGAPSQQQQQQVSSPLSKYRLATNNVKPSLNISPALPSLLVPPYHEMNGGDSHYREGYNSNVSGLSAFRQTQDAPNHHTNFKMGSQ